MLDLQWQLTQQVAALWSHQFSKTGSIPSTWQTWITAAKLFTTHAKTNQLIEMSLPVLMLGKQAPYPTPGQKTTHHQKRRWILQLLPACWHASAASSKVSFRGTLQANRWIGQSLYPAGCISSNKSLAKEILAFNMFVWFGEYFVLPGQWQSWSRANHPLVWKEFSFALLFHIFGKLLLEEARKCVLSRRAKVTEACMCGIWW